MKWKTNVHIVINVSHILKFGKMQTYSAKKKEKKKKRKRRNKKTTFKCYGKYKFFTLLSVDMEILTP
jgi:hypothetical protein